MALSTLETDALVQWTELPSVRCRFRGNGPETEDDILQETFARLLQRKDIVVQRNVHGLAWRTAMNIRKDLAKKMRARNSVKMDAMPLPETEPADALATSEFIANFRALINRLNPNDRRVLELRYFEDLQPAVIGQLIGVAPSAVVMRVGRARKRLIKLAAATNVDLSEGMHLLDAD